MAWPGDGGALFASAFPSALNSAAAPGRLQYAGGPGGMGVGSLPTDLDILLGDACPTACLLEDPKEQLFTMEDGLGALPRPGSPSFPSLVWAL